MIKQLQKKTKICNFLVCLLLLEMSEALKGCVVALAISNEFKEEIEIEDK